METRITRLLDIRYPLIQGGMAWVADCRLAAAVSNAGALGLIADPCRRNRCGTDPKSQELTDKPSESTSC